MREAAKGYLALAGSLTQVTRERATAAARALVAQGEATAEQVGSLVDDVLEQSRQNREAVTALVRHEVERALERLGLTSGDEVTALVERIRALEAEVRRLTRATAAGAGTAAERAAVTSSAGPGTKPAVKAARTRTPAARSAPAAKKAPASKKAAASKTAPASKKPPTAKKAPARGARSARGGSA